jgi:hypothetical protein
MNATTLTSLCPGYNQVDAFGSGDEYDDEEITYVTLDLGSIEPTLVPSSTTYRLIVSLLHFPSHLETHRGRGF